MLSNLLRRRALPLLTVALLASAERTAASQEAQPAPGAANPPTGTAPRRRRRRATPDAAPAAPAAETPPPPVPTAAPASPPPAAEIPAAVPEPPPPPPPPPLTPNAPERGLLRTGPEYSVGLRAWAYITPRFLVQPFVWSNTDWPGAVNFSMGPELQYRSGRLVVLASLSYFGHNAPAAFFRGLNEAENATEIVETRLWGVYGTASFLYDFRLHPMVTFQLGGGIGMGFIGGSLTRTQAYYETTTRTWKDCVNPGTAPECMSDNNHYSGSGYSEPNWAGHGYKPILLPFVSLPHLALEVRPHPHFQFRIEGGYALLAFFAGGAVHYVF